MKVISGIVTVVFSVFEMVFLTLTGCWVLMYFMQPPVTFPSFSSVSGSWLSGLSRTPWLMVLSICLAAVCFLLIALINLSSGGRIAVSSGISLILAGIGMLSMLRLPIGTLAVEIGAGVCIGVGLLVLLIYSIFNMVKKN